MRNSKDVIVKLMSRTLEFPLPILIRLWSIPWCTICFKLMAEFKHSVIDLIEAIKLM